METAFITWILIAMLGAFAVVDYAFINRKKGMAHHSKAHGRHIVEIGNECDELYIPGDINSRHDADVIEYEEEMI